MPDKAPQKQPASKASVKKSGAPDKGAVSKDLIKQAGKIEAETLKAVGKTKLPTKNILKDDGAVATMVGDEAAALNRRQRLGKLINFQNWVIIVLVIVLIMGVPIFAPTYEYYSITPENKLKRMVSLDAPNVTNEALLSWARSSVIEILTLGFGDFDNQLTRQSSRFTEDGWTNFVASVMKNKLFETFTSRQLVLTTAPSNEPVITSQGVDKEDLYKWDVQVPIIMTYTTNNNVTQREQAIISLTIVRVPTKSRARGIAIRSWSFGG